MVVLVQRLEGSGGVRFKEWKGVMVLIQTGRVGGWCKFKDWRGVVGLVQMTNMLVVAFLFGRLLMMSL